jgi:hypothetical protein
MIHSSRHLKWLPVVAALAVVGAFIAAGSASANHPNTGLSPSLNGFIVPVYKQCGTAGNPANSTHSTPLAVQSCGAPGGPALQDGGGATTATGPDLATKPVWPFSIRFTKPGVGAPCANGNPGSTVCLDVSMPGVEKYTTATPPYTAGAPFAGSLAAVARIRFTDHYNCTPKPCGAPFTQPGTGTDLDFGPVPIACSAGNCSVSTDANAVVAGSVVNGIKTNIQVFRVRVTVPTNPGAQQLLGQQGIAWP